MLSHSVQYNGPERVNPLISEEEIGKYPDLIQDQLRELNKKAEQEEKANSILRSPHKIPYARSPDENKISANNINDVGSK